MTTPIPAWAVNLAEIAWACPEGADGYDTSLAAEKANLARLLVKTRADALREAVGKTQEMAIGNPRDSCGGRIVNCDGDRMTIAAVGDAILALIDKEPS